MSYSAKDNTHTVILEIPGTNYKTYSFISHQKKWEDAEHYVLENEVENRALRVSFTLIREVLVNGKLRKVGNRLSGGLHFLNYK